MKELETADNEYLRNFPEEESLFNYLGSFTAERIVEIYNESKGRKIIFTELKGYDHYKYSFE